MKVLFRAFLLSILGFLTLGTVAFAQTTVSATPGVHAPGTSASGLFLPPGASASAPESHAARGEQPLSADAALSYFDPSLAQGTFGIQQIGQYVVYAYGERMTLASNTGFVDSVQVAFATMSGDSVAIVLWADTLYPNPSATNAFHLINILRTGAIYAVKWVYPSQVSGITTVTVPFPHVAVPQNFFVVAQANVNTAALQITSGFTIVGDRKPIVTHTQDGSHSAFLAFVGTSPTTSLFDSVFVDAQQQPIYSDFYMTAFVQQGAASPAVLSFSPSPLLGFGTISASTQTNLLVTVKNTGGSDAAITAATVDAGTPFTVGTQSYPLIVPPDGTVYFDITFAPTAAGTYSSNLTLTLGDGMTKVLPLQGIASSSGVAIPSNTAAAELHLFPNPASSSIQIQSSETASSVELLDLLGRTVLSQKLSGSGTLDVSRLEPGRYEAVVHTSGGIVTAPVIIQH